MVGHSWRHFDPVNPDRRARPGRLRRAGDLLRLLAPRRRGRRALHRCAATHHLRPRRRAHRWSRMTRVDYRLIDALGWLAYGFGIVVLVAVLFLGSDEFGSRRWFDLGFTVVQASEIGKLMTIIGLGKFLTDYRDRLAGVPHLPALPRDCLRCPQRWSSSSPTPVPLSVFMALWLVMTLFAGARLRHYADARRNRPLPRPGRTRRRRAGLPARPHSRLHRSRVRPAGRRVST